MPVPFAPTRPIRSRGPMAKLARSRTTFGPKARESSLAETRLMAEGKELTFLQAANKGATPPARMLPPSPRPLRAGQDPGHGPEKESAMKKIIAAAGAVAALALGVVALTGFRGGCGCHGHGAADPAQVAAFVTDRVDDALDDLDATPEQRTRIHAVKDRLLAAGQTARAGHAEAHAALLAEWKAEPPDAAKLHALVDARIEELRGARPRGGGRGDRGARDPDGRAAREGRRSKIERWHR